MRIRLWVCGGTGGERRRLELGAIAIHGLWGRGHRVRRVDPRSSSVGGVVGVSGEEGRRKVWRRKAWRNARHRLAVSVTVSVSSSFEALGSHRLRWRVLYDCAHDAIDTWASWVEDVIVALGDRRVHPTHARWVEGRRKLLSVHSICLRLAFDVGRRGFVDVARFVARSWVSN